MKTIMIDFVNYSIEMELEIKNWPHKTDEGMYYDTDMGKVCVAYCFKPEDRNAIQAYLDSIKEQEKLFNQYKHDTITKTMLQFRRDQ